MSAAILRYERPAEATEPLPAVPLERGRGVAELAFARRDGETGLARLFQRTPCRILFPRPEADDLPSAVLLTTSGGLAGGDTLHLDIAAHSGARAVVATQAAEKVYRSLGEDCRVAATLWVEDGAWLEWLPQETILFEGARLRRSTAVDVAPGGRFLGCEMVVFGRRARGECLTRGLLHDAWAVRRAGRLAWTDVLRLDGEIAGALAAPMAFAGAAALATVLYVGEDAGALLPAARRLAADGASRGGATLVNGVLLARFLAPEAASVREHLGRYLAGLRSAAAGLPPRLPRVWSI
jgi:urease accessory protein